MSADLPAVGAGEGLVAQRTGLDVRGEILVQLAAVWTHALVTLHVRTSFNFVIELFSQLKCEIFYYRWAPGTPSA